MKAVSAYTAPVQQLTTVEFLMNVIPDPPVTPSIWMARLST